MSALYLFRHGQAGFRDDYDRLSPTGQTQARLLGEYLAQQNLPFAAFFTGALQRQQQTARLIHEAYPQIPAPTIDPLWNEFDLSAVYDGIAPQIAAVDAEFRAHYQSLQAATSDRTSEVHRRWTTSDVAVVRAWVEGRYSYQGESWLDFTARVGQALDTIRSFAPGENIAISTSATPIAIWTGLALQLKGQHVMRLAGALYNASFTTLRFHENELYLFSFNNVPHLATADLRTFR